MVTRGAVGVVLGRAVGMAWRARCGMAWRGVVWRAVVWRGCASHVLIRRVPMPRALRPSSMLKLAMADAG